MTDAIHYISLVLNVGLWFLLGRIEGDIKRLDEKINRHLKEKK